jgi:hypothetical protein
MMAFSVLTALRAAGHAELARRVAEEVMVAIGKSGYSFKQQV